MILKPTFLVVVDDGRRQIRSYKFGGAVATFKFQGFLHGSTSAFLRTRFRTEMSIIVQVGHSAKAKGPRYKICARCLLYFGLVPGVLWSTVLHMAYFNTPHPVTSGETWQIRWRSDVVISLYQTV